jgi:hypothetical protein
LSGGVVISLGSPPQPPANFWQPSGLSPPRAPAQVQAGQVFRLCFDLRHENPGVQAFKEFPWRHKVGLSGCEVEKFRFARGCRPAHCYHQKDPSCKIYLRCSKANEISAWQREMLERLFVKEKLPSVLEEGMKEYEAGKEWPGYDQNEKDNYDDIKRHGIVPFLTIHEIVIDDVTKEVLISANTDWDGHLDEHGITIYLSEGRWRFDLGDRQYDYYSGIESEVTKARMAKVFPDILSNRSESDDIKFIFGTWNYVEKAAVEIYKKFKWTKSKIDNEVKCYEGMRLIISPDQMQRIIRNDHGSSYFEARFVRCERRGNVIRIFYERKWSKGIDAGSYDCYYTGDVMVAMDFNGEILKRVSATPRFEDKEQL